MKNRFYILIFSPLPPVRSGIADYVNEQMPYFPATWQLGIFGIVVDQDSHTDLSALDHVHVLLLSEYQNLRDEFAGIPKLYHLGNNIHHLFVCEELQRAPGVLVLHDVCQHHLLVEYTLAQGDKEGYRALLGMELGEQGEQLADSRDRGIWSDLFNFMVPLNAP